MSNQKIWEHQLLSEENLMQTTDIIAIFYKVQIWKSTFEEREYHLYRYIRNKYINDVPIELTSKFNEASKLFAKIISIIFEENWRLKKSHLLNLMHIVEWVFRSNHNNETIIRIMFYYLENAKALQLGYRIKKEQS